MAFSTVLCGACLLIILTASVAGASQSAASETPLYWASSGGGWRSMVAGMGYVYAFAQAGLIDSNSSRFNGMAGASGGSWLQLQLLYSQSFFDRIVVQAQSPQQVAALADEWMTAFSLDLNQSAPTEPDPRCSTIAFAVALFPDFQFLQDACTIFAPLEWDYAVFIQNMLNVTSTMVYNDPDFIRRTLTPENRVPAFQHTDLHVQMALAADSRIQNNATVFLGPANDVTLDYAVPVAIQYVVSDNETLYAFGVDAAEYPFRTHVEAAPSAFDTADWTDYYLYLPPSDATEFGRTRRGNSVTGSFRELFGGTTPTVTQIAAATSTADASSSPAAPLLFARRVSQAEFFLQQLPNITQVEIGQGEFLLNTVFNNIWETPIFSDFAMCSQWPQPCGAQDGRLIDGSNADFMAVAQTVAEYQRVGNPNTPLKLIVTNNNNFIFGNQDFLSYFNTTFYGDGVMPGDFYWPMDPNFLYPTPQRSLQIFGDYMDDEKLLAAFEPIEGTNLTTAVYEATTINNVDFHIEAGWKVEILLLQINSNIPTLFDPMFLPNFGELVASVAASEELVVRIQAFVDAPDPLTSSPTAVPTALAPVTDSPVSTPDSITPTMEPNHTTTSPSMRPSTHTPTAGPTIVFPTAEPDSGAKPSLGLLTVVPSIFLAYLMHGPVWGAF